MKGKWLILISLALLLAGIKTGWVVYEGYKKGQEEYRDVRQKYFLTEAEQSFAICVDAIIGIA